MAAVALIRRRNDIGTGHQRLYHAGDGFWPDPRHVGQRDDPSRRIARHAHAMRQTDAHALRRIRTDRDAATLLLQQLCQWKIARAHHGSHIQSCGDQIACCVRGDGRSIFQHMQKFAAAEARTRARSQQYRHGKFVGHAVIIMAHPRSQRSASTLSTATHTMPKLCANLTMLFNEVPFLDRFAAAAKAGFRGVEYLFPYEYDKQTLADALNKNGLVQVLHNMPAGNWAAGERGIGCHPQRVAEFKENVDRAIDYATALNCKQVNCLAGIRPPHVDPLDARETFIRNLQYAAPKFKDAGIKLLIEPINTRDIPGFFLNYSQQAVDIIKAVGSDNLFLQYDIYHMQIMEGDLARGIENNLPLIPHMQLADNPGRHEPGTGEINFPWLFSHIDKIGYTGWVGCEYKPATTTEAGLGWASPYLSAA